MERIDVIDNFAKFVKQFDLDCFDLTIIMECCVREFSAQGYIRKEEVIKLMDTIEWVRK